MQSNTYSGKFIVFEGLDGSGQSTQVKLLADYLRGQGKSVVATKEPTSTSDAGREIIDILSHKKIASPGALQELFASDRRAHLNQIIIPALAKGDIVISDRYVFSSFAFGSLECDLAWLKGINSEFLWPDITFLLRVRADVSLTRISARGKNPEFFEKKEKLEKVAINYDNLVNAFERCVVLDGEQSPEAVHKNVIQNLTNITI
jgi:dTMP kinase